MRHSRRTRLKTDDVDNALKARNLEPLWGFASTSHLPFKKTVTPTGIVYSIDDEEIDLSKVIKGDMPSVPRDISFTGAPESQERRSMDRQLLTRPRAAHWLAIEGVQPLIKENPSPAGTRLPFARPSSISEPRVNRTRQARPSFSSCRRGSCRCRRCSRIPNRRKLGRHSPRQARPVARAPALLHPPNRSARDGWRRSCRDEECSLGKRQE